MTILNAKLNYIKENLLTLLTMMSQAKSPKNKTIRTNEKDIIKEVFK